MLCIRYGRGLTPGFNLDTTLNGFLLLFVIATGDGFSSVIRDTQVRWPECTQCTACKVAANTHTHTHRYIYIYI